MTTAHTARSSHKRTPAAMAAVVSALEKGASRTAACAAAGISLDTLARWRSDDPVIDAKIVQAEGRAEKSMSEALFSAAEAGDWRAAEAWLKRRRPQEWGDKSTTEVSGQIGAAVPAMFAEMLKRVYEDGQTEQCGGGE